MDIGSAEPPERKPVEVFREGARQVLQNRKPNAFSKDETCNTDDHGQEKPALVGWEWSKRQSVVELFPCLSSPNRTGTSQRIRLSVQVLLIAKVTSA